MNYTCHIDWIPAKLFDVGLILILYLDQYYHDEQAGEVYGGDAEYPPSQTSSTIKVFF